jgi:hypothetical protein
MGSKPPSRSTFPRQPAGEEALVALPEGAAAESAVLDWRVALAEYLRALAELGEPPAPEAAERERTR